MVFNNRVVPVFMLRLPKISGSSIFVIYILGTNMYLAFFIYNYYFQAQKISVDKCKKVLNDIIKTMLSDTFIEELFKPQVLL